MSRPTKHIIGHIGDGFFYGSDDPTNNVKALKEGSSYRYHPHCGFFVISPTKLGRW